MSRSGTSGLVSSVLGGERPPDSAKHEIDYGARLRGVEGSLNGHVPKHGERHDAPVEPAKAPGRLENVVQLRVDSRARSRTQRGAAKLLSDVVDCILDRPYLGFRKRRVVARRERVCVVPL